MAGEGETEVLVGLECPIALSGTLRILAAWRRSCAEDILSLLEVTLVVLLADVRKESTFAYSGPSFPCTHLHFLTT